MDFRKVIYYIGCVMGFTIIGYFVLVAALNDRVDVTWGAIVIVGAILYVILRWFKSTIDDY